MTQSEIEDKIFWMNEQQDHYNQVMRRCKIVINQQITGLKKPNVGKEETQKRNNRLSTAIIELEYSAIQAEKSRLEAEKYELLLK